MFTGTLAPFLVRFAGIAAGQNVLDVAVAPAWWR
jgi:hypothetical protein